MPTLEINGTKLFYSDVGQGAPVIFHHAYAVTHHSWLAVTDRLSQHHRCILLDARGVGASGRPESGYTIDQLAADVVGLADALKLERFCFVGHSMGGVVGMQLGMAHAGRLEKLALVAPGPSNGLTVPEGVREILFTQWQKRDHGALERGRRAMIARDRAFHGLAEAVERSLDAAEGHKFGCFDDLIATRRGEGLAQVQTPTLVVAGASDPLLAANLADYGRLPNASLQVFHRVGHSVPSEVPEPLAEVLVDFFSHGVVSAEKLQLAATKHHVLTRNQS